MNELADILIVVPSSIKEMHTLIGSRFTPCAKPLDIAFTSRQTAFAANAHLRAPFLQVTLRAPKSVFLKGPTINRIDGNDWIRFYGTDYK
jgi:hypothetical protein